jgi:hypothetical protein
MRSLGSIRARVERLASAWPTSPQTTFVSWVPPIERCPACACDLTRGRGRRSPLSPRS